MSIKDLPHVTVEQVLELRQKSIQVEQSLKQLVEACDLNEGSKQTLECYKEALQKAKELLNG